MSWSESGSFVNVSYTYHVAATARILLCLTKSQVIAAPTNNTGGTEYQLIVCQPKLETMAPEASELNVRVAKIIVSFKP